MSQDLSLLADLVAAAKRAGADAADALLARGTSLSVAQRLGKTEHVERSEGVDLGLRVFIGKRQAIVSSSDPDPKSFEALVTRAIAMAKVVPEDPFCGLAEGPFALDIPDYELADSAEPDTAALIARAAAAEGAALAVAGVSNSEGADAGYGRTAIAIVASNGFAGAYARTSHSISATALAGSGTGMERDYDYSSAVFLEDLEDPELIGRRAGEQAVRRLNPTRPKTAKLPVVYAPRIAGSLLGHLSGAINGASIARGTSFLRDKLGQQVLAKGLTVHDDPTRRRGLRSRPFDAEGTRGVARKLVDDGVLTTWVMDTRSARQLGMKSTGHASRGTSGPPSPATTNLWLEAGSLTPEALMADIKEGLYVTEMIGTSLSATTGDYSRGAAGFMIRDGQLAEAVSEITVAGNIKDVFLNMTPANDLAFRRGTDAPTVRVEGLTLAGS
ncbi:TldD/PmbA family protein [Acetobacteraceae bacterium H6797]|nr:TldD/PmbA family protein [Acetobacteraceae bacterium H6797]